MDTWEEGFDTWTPPAEKPGGAAADTGTDLDREELLRLARELAVRRQAEQSSAQKELDELKRSLRERAEAVAARERELDRLQRQIESGRPSVRGRIEELRSKRSDRPETVDEEALAARERAALERLQALEKRERAAAQHAAELEAATARLAERERELAAQARLAETAAERELTQAERERLEERDRAAHEVEKQLATARIELEQERQRLETRMQTLEQRARELEAQGAAPADNRPADSGDAEGRNRTLQRLESKLETRERELALIRQGVDAERNALLERERALRRREVATVRESFAPPLAPPSFNEGLAALARSRSRDF